MKKILTAFVTLSFILPAFSYAQVLPLSVYCYPNSSNATVGASVVWSSVVYGGNGNYTYYWAGDEGLYGNTSVISKSYSSIGLKSATLTINSGGIVSTVNCGSANVYQYPTNYYPNQVLGYNQQSNLSAVYLNNVPYTGTASDNGKRFLLYIETFSLLVALFLMFTKDVKLTD